MDSHGQRALFTCSKADPPRSPSYRSPLFSAWLLVSIACLYPRSSPFYSENLLETRTTSSKLPSIMSDSNSSSLKGYADSALASGQSLLGKVTGDQVSIMMAASIILPLVRRPETANPFPLLRWPSPPHLNPSLFPFTP